MEGFCFNTLSKKKSNKFYKLSLKMQALIRIKETKNQEVMIEKFLTIKEKSKAQIQV